MEYLSLAAKSLWAKKDARGDCTWLPLVVHMKDSAFVAGKLWDSWLAPGSKYRIIKSIGCEKDAKDLLIFLAAAHDIGKSTPVFQSKMAFPRNFELDKAIRDKIALSGLYLQDSISFINSRKTPHALATQSLLEIAGCDLGIAAILGAHHGKPQNHSSSRFKNLRTYGYNYYQDQGEGSWREVQNEIIKFALKIAGLTGFNRLVRPDLASQVLLSGLVIMADWIASNENYFPYIELDSSINLLNIKRRNNLAWERFSPPSQWSANTECELAKLYSTRFGFEKANRLQTEIIDIADSPGVLGIVVVEAPMGYGKTEAALACAEMLAEQTQKNGIFFALPTQATSDGIFLRIERWINKLDTNDLHSIALAHGKAQFNKDYQDLKFLEGATNVSYDQGPHATVHEWFEGTKKSMLADFVVGTIDQLLLAALKQKHVMLRHLGLAQKVVIIDECHAYDAYMSQYLERALEWLGAYDVPVIILSATLPVSKRESLIRAYLKKSEEPKEMIDLFGNRIKAETEAEKWVSTRAYPLITYTSDQKILQRTITYEEARQSVEISTIDVKYLAKELEALLSGGGCAGIIVNTVRRAQEIAGILCERFPEGVVNLIHSKFLTPDRLKKEKKLSEDLGTPRNGKKRPHIRIDVGTQVIEQSLDIDFDVLFTEIAPMDLLLQRIGRLHRHRRKRRPKLVNPKCLILKMEDEGFDSGTEAIYGTYLLQKTTEILPQTIRLPDDISNLVQEVYKDIDSYQADEKVIFEAEKQKHETALAIKRQKAKQFRLGPVWEGEEYNLLGWLDRDLSQQHGEAAVRDGDDSVEVIVVGSSGEGKVKLLSEQDFGIEVSESEVPSVELGQAIARQRVSLPRVLCHPGIIDSTIRELERINRDRFIRWQENSWLKGELVLPLDEENSIALNGWNICYDSDKGLIYQREESCNEKT